ncbi:MAG: signal recognition particle-docking protein FtsY [Chloroflexota bacterium]|nr:signal recognition particle-docking protein FtsY [Chloroflexota bacterium]
MKGLFESLRKTSNAVFGRIVGILGSGEITTEIWEEVEALLIQGDVGVHTALALVERLQEAVQEQGIYQSADLQKLLLKEIGALFPEAQPLNLDWPLAVILVVGVNGSGKTTSIAKLALRLKQQGRKVILAAADTFRAAAVEQLVIWGERVGVPVVQGEAGGDPGAVVYDAIQIAKSKGMDTLIIDTAGRLHTQHNLMEELRKLRHIVSKRVAWGPHETLLVLDATTGQNGLSQAQHFLAAAAVSGVILAKLDGSAKGGMGLSISEQLHLPIRFVGTGESEEDFAPFDKEVFIRGLLGAT